MKQRWRTLNGMQLQPSIKEAVRNRLAQEIAAGHKIKVCIGTDSQVKSRKTEFATVIVFLRKGKGGFMFIHSEQVVQKMSIKERMLKEVLKSIEIAYELCDVFTAFNTELEVHADINTDPAFKSNDALKDAMGYITGMGFAFRAKPQAFASTNCANKIVQ
ncbi:ribonuclease H-like YkuK family protein [Niabella ginsengisoli]|uniref:Ribonuclease H-like YkuK family protein n=1 Tax=Niabella ginsengisoli TaxID=522298 RepID=A0ABS9SRG2_9BACT|nr:ribonuclease H-like YkuK family protein [Niabella ginsengisoli]MCH5600851.1 ribonuclease H-like YkuK family protein [Niabella ginsengisoli]